MSAEKIQARFLPRWLAAPLLALAMHCAAAVEALPAVASFFQSPQIGNVALSPDGGFVAMVVRRAGGVGFLAVADTGDTGKNWTIVKTSDEEIITDVHWINERRLGFTVKNRLIEFEGNWDEFAADRDGTNLSHLISGNWRHRHEKLGSRVWSQTLTADYGFYDVAHDGSDDILVQKYFWNAVDMASERTQLYRLNSRTMQLSPAFAGQQPPHVTRWLTDSQDVPRIVEARAKGRCITYYRKADEQDWREIQNDDCYQGSHFKPLFFAGADILYVSANRGGFSALFRYDLNTMRRNPEPLVVVAGFDFNGRPERDRAANKLLGLHLLADGATTAWLDAGLKAEQASVDAALPATVNVLRCGRDCGKSPVLLVQSASDRQPTRYYLYTRAGGKLTGLGDAYPGIVPAQMGTRELRRYTARDGRSIPVFVTTPPGKGGAWLPTVLLVHGGPHVRGAQWEWDDEAQFLASRGYLVIQPEFRGSTGFGVEHFQAGWKQWGGAMQDDLADAASWAVEQGWADSGRVAIMGASYGGYATLMGLIKHPRIFRCGVALAAVTDLKLMFTSWQSDASQESRDYDMRTLIGDPDRDAELFRQNSPVARAAELKQPLLMAHGAEDWRVPLEHAERFRDAIRRTNSQVTSLIYKNEGHSLAHEENQIDYWTQVEAFLARNLKAGQ